MLNRSQIAAQIEGLNYILGKISRYLKQNQYIYLRPFESWQGAYNEIASTLRQEQVLSAPGFELQTDDMTPSGKSVCLETVERLIRTIEHQVSCLDEILEELNRQAAEKLAAPPSLARFFDHDAEGNLLVPTQVAGRVLAAVPDDRDGAALLEEGIKPVLEAQGLSCFCSSQLLDDVGLAEFCREMQACQLVLLDLAGEVSRVMFALGVAYGVGKPVILLRPREANQFGKQYNDGELIYTTPEDVRAALGPLLKRLTESATATGREQEKTS